MHRPGGVRVPRWDIVFGAGEMNPSSEDEAEMYKRMLRSVLATAFVGTLALMAVSAQGAGDITWGAPTAESAPTANLAAPGDITWDSTAATGA